jgi:hypothetical protein
VAATNAAGPRASAKFIVLAGAPSKEVGALLDLPQFFARDAGR